MDKKENKILIIDDDEYVRLSLRMLLEQYFSSVTAAAHPSQINDILEKENFDVVLLDMNFKHGATSGEEGLLWLKKIKAISSLTSVILMTAYADVETAVEGIQEGALDFLIKPWQNEKVLATVNAAVDLNKEKKKVALLKERQKFYNVDTRLNEDTLGISAPMLEIKRIINKIADTDANVLITGENGTGKEVLARQIHQRSSRRKDVFMAVDLGALNENIFESELFGHIKGSFTDARENRIGRFEAASGGTLFLDEIGNLTPGMQSKLLTVLQRKEIVPLGSNQPVKVDVRIICATNSNLIQMVKDGQFREDLLYRINTVAIQLPPLRERQDDIQLLSDYFYKKYAQKYHKEISGLNNNVIQLLKKYQWPGNIRELEHAMERAVIMADEEELSEKDFNFLNSDFQHADPFEHLNLENIEEWAIRKALKKHNGNISHAADELGLSRGAMYRRMEKYNI